MFNQLSSASRVRRAGRPLSFMSRIRIFHDLAAMMPTHEQPRDDDTPSPASTYNAAKLPAHTNTNKHASKESSKDKGDEPKPKPSPANLKSNEGAPPVAAAAVPAPVPDTGIAPTAVQNFASQPLPPPPPPSSTQAIPQTPLAPFPSASSVTTAGAAIPSLLLTSAAPLATVQSENAASAEVNHPGTSPHAKPLAPAIIALIAVGGAMLVLAFYLCARMLRPRQRIRPTPSLPILDAEIADYAAEKDGLKRRAQLAPDESPLFGGSERFSRADGAPVKWTQYQSGVPAKLAASASQQQQVHAVSFALENAGTGHVQYASPASPAAAEIRMATAATYAHPVAVAPPHPQALAAVHAHTDALRGKYTSRLSTLTLAPEPPAELAAAGAIGVAVSGEDISLAGYGDDEAAAVARPAAAARRLSRSASAARRRSRAQDTRRSTYHDDGLAYDAPEAEPEAEPAGRARIKAPYDVRSYIRTSYATSAPGARASVYAARESRVPAVPPLAAAPGRTDALAHVLGLDRDRVDARATLYPDDSLSRQASLALPPARARKPAVEEKRERESALLGSPSTALGRLMLDPASPQPELHLAYAGVADRPPRVPSPPPLPSLAQMAMENQEGFDDYRSPTYSIYGLYEADRKSRGVSRAVW